MQGVVRNIDHVAKINKVHEQSLAGQQDNAKMQHEKNVKHNMNSVVEASETEKKTINKDGRREKGEQNEKKELESNKAYNQNLARIKERTDSSLEQLKKENQTIT